MTTEIKRDFILNRQINYLAEAGGLLTSYTYWRAAINKKQIPWDQARLDTDFTQNKTLAYLADFLPPEDYEDFLDFIQGVRREALAVLEEYFQEGREEILKLCYIFYPYTDTNQYAFLPDVLTNAQGPSIENYSLEDFRLDLYKTFTEFLNLDKDDDSRKLYDSDQVYDLVNKTNYIEVLASSDFPDQDLMTLIRALNNYQEIYKDLLPLIQDLEKIIAAKVSLIEYRIKKSFDHLEKTDFSLAKRVLKEIGFEKFHSFKGDQIILSLRLVLFRAITVGFSTLKTRQPEIYLGILSEDIIEKANLAYNEYSFKRKLKVLGDPTRFSIISLLRTRPYYLQELADALHLSPATLSYHINYLQVDGFLNLEAQGRRTYYSLRKEAFQSLAKDLKNFI
ncbi:MAG: metalloregulator ArsR/SmtB family transcription factor [Bacillota bacterium]|nr:metalloregulator ArsR/SmtB family transcription factor [Bacillota bacterium]